MARECTQHEKCFDKEKSRFSQGRKFGWSVVTVPLMNDLPSAGRMAFCGGLGCAAQLEPYHVKFNRSSRAIVLMLVDFIFFNVRNNDDVEIECLIDLFIVTLPRVSTSLLLVYDDPTVQVC